MSSRELWEGILQEELVLEVFVWGKVRGANSRLREGMSDSGDHDPSLCQYLL